MKIPGDHDFFNIFFSRTDFRTDFRADFRAVFRADSRIDSRTDSRTDKHHQIILLKLINFETYYIKSNPPLFSANKVCNGPATWSILTSHYA
jgi:hypothetical protein